MLLVIFVWCFSMRQWLRVKPSSERTKGVFIFIALVLVHVKALVELDIPTERVFL